MALAADAASPRPRRNARLLITLAIIEAVLAGGVVAAVVVSTASGGSKQITVRGSLTLTNTSGSGVTTLIDGTCEGRGGGSDIAQGAEVVLSDDAGKTLTITVLGAGRPTRNSCLFQFSATVPAGRKFYGVSVSHRPPVRFSEAEVVHADLTFAS
jgi:hypothetical protein